MKIKKSKLSINIKYEFATSYFLQPCLAAASASLCWFYLLADCFAMEQWKLAAAGIAGCGAVCFQWGRGRGKAAEILLSLLYLAGCAASFFVFPVREQWEAVLRQGADKLADRGILFLAGKTAPAAGISWMSVFCAAAVLLAFIVLFMQLQKRKGVFFFIVGAAPIFWMLYTGWKPGIDVLFLFILCFLFRQPPSLAAGIFCAGIAAVFLLFLLPWAQPISIVTGTEKMWEQWRYNYTQALPQGQIRDAGKRSRGEKEMLSVEMSTPSPYYLRGFVGTVFEDGVWTNNKDTIDTLSLQLRESGYGQKTAGGDFCGGKTWLADTFSFIVQGAAPEQKEGKQKLRVENTGADRRFLYLPYESLYSAAHWEENHIAVLGTGENLYASGWRGGKSYLCETYTCLAERIPQMRNKKQEINMEEDDCRKTYEDYVESVCLTLSKEERMVIASLTRKQKASAEITADSAAERITRWLEDNITYDSSPGMIPEEDSFARWFFQKNKQGYDVHYATAAVLMFRYYGIPARYVEGYLVTPQAAENPDGSGKTQVLEKDAHAWAEIYLESVGWIPVEVQKEYEEKMGISYLEGRSFPHISQAADGEQEKKISKKETTKETPKEKTSEEKMPEEETPKKSGRENSFSAGQTEKSGNVLQILFLLVVVITAGAMFYIERRRRKNYKLERKWDMSKDYGFCVEQYYQKMCLLIYELLKKQDEGAVWDNRSRKVKEALLRLDKQADKKQLEKMMEIRQKAVYSPEQISEKEKRDACDFLKKETETLLRNMTKWRRFCFMMKNEEKSLHTFREASCHWN